MERRNTVETNIYIYTTKQYKFTHTSAIDDKKVEKIRKICITCDCSPVYQQFLGTNFSYCTKKINQTGFCSDYTSSFEIAKTVREPLTCGGPFRFRRIDFSVGFIRKEERMC